MNMVEKVAKAIHADEMKRKKGEPIPYEIMIIYYENSARAAIEAIREPNKEMKLAGDKHCVGPTCSFIEITYRAMIDAALKE